MVTTSLGILLFSSVILADDFLVSKPRLNTKVKNILAAENTKITLVFVKSIDWPTTNPIKDQPAAPAILKDP
ncbi:hypothetical protein D3C80_2102080 [compost metagenome]